MVDYEVYSYDENDKQTLEVCDTFPEARKEAAAQRKSGLLDTRVVKHDEDDETTAFWEYRSGRLVRVE